MDWPEDEMTPTEFREAQREKMIASPELEAAWAVIREEIDRELFRILSTHIEIKNPLPVPPQ